MAKYWTEAMIVMKLTWFKVLLIAFIPFGMSITQQTETWSGETWDTSHWFIKWRIFFVGSMQAAIALSGFFDKTSKRVEEELTKHRAERRVKEFIGPPAPDDPSNTQQFLNKL